MFTCKQVSKALAENNYKDLPFFRRFLIRLHISFCGICGKFNRQVIDSHDMCDHYKKRELEIKSSRVKLDLDVKENLKKMIDQETESSDPKQDPNKNSCC